jgi:hypothetical protein
MLNALVAGTTDPQLLPELAKGRLRQKIPPLREALEGRIEAHHADHRRDPGAQKTTVSYADMLAALRRELIRHEFWQQAPPTTITPKPTSPQSPPAYAAA